MSDWFDSKHIKKHKKITLNKLHGYVLPHAGTTYTGDILSHTLRFRPKKIFDTILIIYLPSTPQPDIIIDINTKYYHEYYVIYETLKKIFPNKKYIGFNLTSEDNPDISGLEICNTLYIISADFSHFLPFDDAIKKENCAAHALVLKQLEKCNKDVDDIRSFKKLYELLPNINLQWVGRSRSSGVKGVGYLSFLIREQPILDTNSKSKPDGFFVTAYDEHLRQRECLGNPKEWSKALEKELTNEVISNAKLTSRLTNGEGLDIPITNYIVTYLFKDDSQKFIRGWHSILMNALYLFDVFLENTHDNGDWIKATDTEWKRGENFDLEPTKQKLKKKARKFGVSSNNTNYQLYTNEIKRVSLIKKGGFRKKTCKKTGKKTGKKKRKKSKLFNKFK